MNGRVRVGTASWSDPGFVDRWYPPRLPASERLRWYARHFDMVELNSSFYGIPSRQAVERWCFETPPPFLFHVKLHRLLSRHSTPLHLLTPDLRPLAEVRSGKIRLTPELEAAALRKMLESIEPLEQAGKLGLLLLQLSPSFSPRKHSLDELNLLAEAIEGRDLAVEFRNRHWVEGEQRHRTEDFLRRHHWVWVSVDAPETDHFMAMPPVDLTTHPRIAYFRLHGRNAEGYVRGRTVAERFDHAYSDAELEEIAGRLPVQTHAEVHVVFNNNAYDYAPRAALRMKEILASKALAFSPVQT